MNSAHAPHRVLPQGKMPTLYPFAAGHSGNRFIWFFRYEWPDDRYYPLLSQSFKKQYISYSFLIKLNNFIKKEY